MAMVTGQGAALQVGQETTWGTAVAPTVAINFTSEGFKPVLTQTEENSLVGGATSAGIDIQKKSVSWSMDILAKPKNIGLLLGLAFGTEAAAVKNANNDAYKHAFTMLEPSVSATLPKFTGIVNRHIAKKAYTGCKVDSLSISCNAGDYMRISLSGSGKDEVDGASYFDSSLAVPDLKAFRFAGGTCTIDSSSFGSIKSVKFDLSNSLDDGEQTMGSGYYGTEPEPQKRSVKLSLEALYDSASETIRENKYKKGTAVAVVLNFESPSEAVTDVKHSIQISIPNLVISDADPNITGAEKINLTINGTATETSDTKAVTVYLIDDQSTKYLA